MAGGASERVLNVVDPNQVLEYVDMDHLLDRVDINALLNRVDFNALLDRVEPDQLLDRIDVNRLLERVDIDSLLSKADVDALMARVDVKALVDRAGIPEIVAESTSHLTGSALDLVRRPLVGLDLVFSRALNRLIGRDQREFPDGPSSLVEWVDRNVGDGREVKTGRYAGPVTRLLAALLDVFIITASFSLSVGLVDFAAERFFANFEPPLLTGVWYGVGLGLWAFFYLLLGIAIAGKTPGKAVLGLRVVTAGGNPALQRKEPVIRVLTLPFSFILGLGLFGIVWGRERRAWHDHFAGTAVVYDWGSRTASLPTPLAKFLERKEVSVASDEEE